MNAWSLSFAPLLPWPVIVGLGVVATVVVVLLLLARRRGASARALALALFIAALTGPSLLREARDILPNVVAVVVDHSASQTLQDRRRQTEAVQQALATRLKDLHDIEVRTIEAGSSDANGTALFGALQAGLADVPADRVGGAILVTDGVVHDVPANAASIGLTAPVHALVTGHADERDRRITLTDAPRFGIVGHPQTVGFQVVDQGTGLPASATVVVRRDGEEVARLEVAPGATSSAQVPIAHGGPNVVEVLVLPAEGELTEANNVAVLPIEGVRDKMRVLLVSGEPHAGERTWRNLLKADTNVELVHFTILRPPQKQDGTPINELSLIAFPTRQLFSEKISDFDLIIFDRYAQEGILPPYYFQNISDYVRNGGAVLLASGPDYASPDSLWGTPLSDILPAEPTGHVLEQPFKPMVTDLGRRHPVTRDLPGSAQFPPGWSDWFRVVESSTHGGITVMSGADQPLLVLAHQEKGRVAQMLSDHVWLWARGYQGGGPHADLLRRLSHWLMKEPELDEEALRARAEGSTLTVERQTMADRADPVTLTAPDGSTRAATLSSVEPGLWRTSLTADQVGLWRARSGDLQAFAAVGPPNPRELQEVASTTDRLQAIAAATGGSVRRVEDGSGVTVPRVEAVLGSSSLSGESWIGVRAAEASVVRGIAVFPLFQGLAGLALLIGALGLAWAREAR